MVTNKPKIQVVVAAEESPPTGGRGGKICGTRGDPYAEESEVETGIHGDVGVLGFWYPRSMCIFEVIDVDTDA